MAAKNDLGQAEVQKTEDKVEEKGRIGVKPAGPPNSAFSLESGPDSPSAREQRIQALRAEIKTQEG